ncbi:hypothetical protein CAS74_003764 [Pichia kudriavzevii]|uniref:Uncharacterized protein n=2 Tax=Pichia kudriavzevii TaxID=4909 RepID=A0A1Z8JM40_PICKU|nr:hypothetical protein CAS74_003764 [Pichia kudriavzevii]
MARLAYKVDFKRGLPVPLIFHSMTIPINRNLALVARTQYASPVVVYPPPRVGKCALDNGVNITRWKVRTSGSDTLQYSSGNNNKISNKKPEVDTEYLRRKANLGSMVQILQVKVPKMLNKLPPKEIISKNITLRVLPNQFPNLPQFKGYLLYSTALKAIQKLLSMFYLNPDSEIHVTNIKIIEPTNSMSSDELIKLSIDNTLLENEKLENIPNQDASKYTTKIKVKWRTCLSGCQHLRDKKTRDAKFGSYSLDNFDWTKFLKSPNPLETVSLLEAKKTLEGFAKSLDPSGNNNENVGRVLTGVFIFELDAKNEKITVMTIDNMEILESEEMNYSDNILAA